MNSGIPMEDWESEDDVDFEAEVEYTFKPPSENSMSTPAKPADSSTSSHGSTYTSDEETKSAKKNLKQRQMIKSRKFGSCSVEEYNVKRRTANQHERRRMQRLNDSLRQLKSVLPSNGKRVRHQYLSKINTIRSAMEYIGELTEQLNDSPVVHRRVESATISRIRGEFPQAMEDSIAQTSPLNFPTSPYVMDPTICCHDHSIMRPGFTSPISGRLEQPIHGYFPSSNSSDDSHIVYPSPPQMYGSGSLAGMLPPPIFRYNIPTLFHSTPEHSKMQYHTDSGRFMY